MPLLFHISETPNIARFDPRPDDHGNLVVWAIDEAHLPNYLLPRDCPRVCVKRVKHVNASQSDHEITLLQGAEHAIYVEEAWCERIRVASLFCYCFDAATFASVDSNAGYFQARNSVTAINVETISNLEAEHARRGVALIYVDALWPIRDQAVASTLAFSCIRMSNAAPE